MRTTDGVGDYVAWRRNARRHDLGRGLVVVVGSPTDLLASKEAAGRDKDLAALPFIRAELVAAGTLRADEARGPIADLPVDEPPDEAAIAVLGPRPDDRRGRGLWSHGADVLRGYRERWSISDMAEPLGPPVDPGDPRHADRANVERQLRRTRRLLDRAGHGTHDAGSVHRASFPTAPSAGPGDTSAVPTASPPSVRRSLDRDNCER